MSIAVEKSWRPDRNRNRSACLLFVLAIVAQILMPYTQLAANQTADNETDTIVVCTSAGLVTYILNPDGSLQENPVAPNPSKPCEFCQVCQFGTTGTLDVVASVPVEFAPIQTLSFIANASVDQQKILAIVGWHPTRAPPGKIALIG